LYYTKYLEKIRNPNIKRRRLNDYIQRSEKKIIEENYEYTVQRN